MQEKGSFYISTICEGYVKASIALEAVIWPSFVVVNVICIGLKAILIYYVKLESIDTQLDTAWFDIKDSYNTMAGFFTDSVCVYIVDSKYMAVTSKRIE